MMSAAFTLSAFGDEIAEDLKEQVQLLRELKMGYLELRGVWGKNVADLDPEDVGAVRRICAEQHVAISCIGSPVGKSPIIQPLEGEVRRLTRVFQVADGLGTTLQSTPEGLRRVRVFSFYPPDTHTNTHYDRYSDEATFRLARLVDMARREGFCLLLENEKGIVGDTPERCQAILAGVDNPFLRFAWDPANFVQVGVTQPTDRGWPLLGSYIAHVHVKDAVLAGGGVRVAGEGDGQIPELLSALRDRAYRGFLALEPHLTVAGDSSGFSGLNGMTQAVLALRRLLATTGCVEQTTCAVS